MVGMDVRDPTRTSTDNAWGAYTGTELESQREWRAVFWSGGYCTTSKVFGGRKQACDAVFKYHATNAFLAESGNFSANAQIADVFADCKLAQTGLPCTPSTVAEDVAACDAADLSGTISAAKATCEAIETPFSAAGCEYKGAVLGDASATPPIVATPAACVPAPNCEAAETLMQACEECNQQVRVHTVCRALCCGAYSSWNVSRAHPVVGWLVQRRPHCRHQSKLETSGLHCVRRPHILPCCRSN
jgi:hypothetical protein